MPPDERTLEQLSLTREEYERIVDLLDREPNEVELGMFSALWSEHCGYKNSKPLLKHFPSEGERVRAGAGQENAGVVDIGDGIGVAFKIESHNHPSAIEPYQGAATGVGGIVRDIFAMGARPIAILDPLRFGPLQPRSAGAPPAGLPLQGVLSPVDDEQAARNRRLFSGVVSGIGGYGNCLGVPTVGGEASFAPAYSGNPLVNAMCLGLVRLDQLLRARADGPGNLLMLVGADTGRDGIHGATFASVQLDESSEERRPAVQVGNPFLEKLLMEACCSLAEDHPQWVVGLQDCGAAGLTSAAVECAAKAGTGVVIDVATVPRREADMTPYEVMLSESQERMLVIVAPEHEGDVRAHFEHWELHCATIGTVTNDGLVRIRDGESEVARVAAAVLTNAPTYERPAEKPEWLAQLQAFDVSRLASSNGSLSPSDVLLRLLATPELASKRWVWRQYDHQVGTNTVAGPRGDAAVLRVRGTPKAIAVATDGNAAYTYLDPYNGGAIAVAEAARNVACTGARPVALTNCLNFGNPEKHDVYYQLREAVRGMADAAKALRLPVVSGNVSLYNETAGDPIWPTPVVGAIGLLDDIARAVPHAFQREGDRVLVIGWDGRHVVPSRSKSKETLYIRRPGAVLAGSQYVQLLHGIVAGKPDISLAHEAALQRFLVDAAADRLLRSAHDVSAGGLAVTLAECCVDQGIGAQVEFARGVADTAALFGEQQSCVVVSCVEEHVARITKMASAGQLEVKATGVTGGGRLRIGDVDIDIGAAQDAYESALPRALGERVHGGS